MKAKEANILSYRILFDTKGKLITEISGLPIEDAGKAFSGSDLKIIQTVIREGRQKMTDIHNHLEAELDALNSSVI
tara:strand:- start:61 stop:288 length:228 start_codon:yes stop_codon:yes gene_type:complete